MWIWSVLRVKLTTPMNIWRQLFRCHVRTLQLPHVSRNGHTPAIFSNGCQCAGNVTFPPNWWFFKIFNCNFHKSKKSVVKILLSGPDRTGMLNAPDYCTTSSTNLPCFQHPSSSLQQCQFSHRPLSAAHCTCSPFCSKISHHCKTFGRRCISSKIPHNAISIWSQ